MKKKLAILIPTIPGREDSLHRLLVTLRAQVIKYSGGDVINRRIDSDPGFKFIYFDRIAIIINKDNKEKTTGAKRNELIAAAKHEGYDYVAFFDDDDMPGPTYIQNQMAVVNSGKDCGELWGNIYFSGKKGKPFHHSIIYDKWSENKYTYQRTPNHLNCIRTDISAAFPFPDQVFGEDGKQSEAMAAAGVLKTMHPIDDVIYHYFTGTKGTDLENEIIKDLSRTKENGR